MARPVQEKSLDAVSSAQSGSAIEMGGRISVMMHVIARNVDTTNDTVDVDLEVSQDEGNNWAKLRDETGTQIGQLTLSEAGDPDGTGTTAAHLYIHGVAADKLRANLTNFTDASGSDLEVDVYVGGFGRAPAQNYRTV